MSLSIKHKAAMLETSSSVNTITWQSETRNHCIEGFLALPLVVSSQNGNATRLGHARMPPLFPRTPFCVIKAHTI